MHFRRGICKGRGVVRYLLVLSCVLSNICDLHIEGALILRIGVPERKPLIKLLQLWTQHLKETALLDGLQDGCEDMVPGRVLLLEDVEEGGEDGKRKARSVDWGRCNWLGEVLADFWEEHVDVWRLDDEVDQKVVGRGELALWRSIESSGSDDQLLKSLILLLSLQQRLQLGAKSLGFLDLGDIVDVGCELVGEVLESAVDENLVLGHFHEFWWVLGKENEEEISLWWCWRGWGGGSIVEIGKFLVVDCEVLHRKMSPWVPRFPGKCG